MVPLDFLRSLSEQFLPDTCSVLRATATQSGDGASESWAAVSTVSCRVSPLASGSNETTGADESIRAVNQWAVWLPAGTDVTVADRIGYGSRTFEIGRVGARSFETVRECVCRELT